jgi:hypothetical protein
MWSMYFIYVHEGRTLKPVGIILSRGRAMRKNDGVTKVYCKHIWKCHNETPRTANTW